MYYVKNDNNPQRGAIETKEWKLLCMKRKKFNNKRMGWENVNGIFEDFVNVFSKLI